MHDVRLSSVKPKTKRAWVQDFKFFITRRKRSQDSDSTKISKLKLSCIDFCIIYVRR